MYLCRMKIAKRNWLFRLGIVVIAALLMELISFIQYSQTRKIMEEEMNIRSRVVLGAMADRIDHVMELTEATMRENLLYLRRSLDQPDSASRALVYLIDDNPHVVGGSLAFIPAYYPSKGRLFEPYATKENGRIVLRQIAGDKHDYTRTDFYIDALSSGKADWSDPYSYTDGQTRNLISYSCPVTDASGRIVAVCSLDMDLSWMGDTLNASQRFPSSFGLLLTKDFRLVAGPSPDKISPALVEQALGLLRSGMEKSADGDVFLRTLSLRRDAYWQIAQVYKSDEVYAHIRQIRSRQVILLLLGLAVLFFMIDRFARSERKLRSASEEQARISGELAVARDIQRKMLPTDFPEGVFGRLEPALEVGGDIYDFYIRDGKLFFCIGDVSGKGVPAAMVMAVTHSLFRMVSRKEESPSHILAALNEQLCNSRESNMFVTCFVGCLDLYTGKLRFANAGHDKPFVLSAGVSLLPAKANLPLGVFPQTAFVEQALELSPGDTLFLYTDGLTEAKNLSRKALGRDRVQACLAAGLSSGANSAPQLVQAMAQTVRAFVGEAPQSDDMALLAIRYLPGDLLREHIVLTNQKSEVSRLSDFVKAFFERLSLDRKQASGLRLALEETVVNVINYAYPAGEAGDVAVYADSNHREVRFTVVDSGFPFDPTAVLSADTTLDAKNRPIGGLGIYLTRKLVDSVSYCRKNNQNVLTLTKSIS